MNSSRPQFALGSCRCLETDRTVRSSLGGKLRELQTQLAHTEAAILEKQSTDGGSVADVSSVFTILKAFKNGFEKVDVSLQAEILRDVVAEIEVQREGVLIKIFGLSGGNLAKKRPAVSGQVFVPYTIWWT